MTASEDAHRAPAPLSEDMGARCVALFGSPTTTFVYPPPPLSPSIPQLPCGPTPTLRLTCSNIQANLPQLSG